MKGYYKVQLNHDHKLVKQLPKPSVMSKYTGLNTDQKSKKSKYTGLNTDQVRHLYTGVTMLTPEKAAYLLIGNYNLMSEIYGTGSVKDLEKCGMREFMSSTEILECCPVFKFLTEDLSDILNRDSLYYKIGIIRFCLDIIEHSSTHNSSEDDDCSLTPCYFPLSHLVHSFFEKDEEDIESVFLFSYDPSGTNGDMFSDLEEYINMEQA